MSVIQTRIDDKSRATAEAIFNEMGMSISDGIRIFIHQVINENGLPFCPRASHEPNEETAKVIEDAKNGIGLSRPFDNLDELFKELELC